MPRLSIDLQNGFTNDEVILRVAGTEVFHKGEVATDLAIGLAGSCQTEVPAGPVKVEAAVPSRGLRETIELDAARTPFLGVSVGEGRLELRPSETMFFYL